MLLALLSQYSTEVLIVLGVALAISGVASILAYRRARHDPYYFLRQEAAVRCRRLVGLSVVLLLALAGSAWFTITRPAPPPALASKPSPSATPTGMTAPSIPIASDTPAPPLSGPSTTANQPSGGTSEPAVTPTRAPARFESLFFARGVSQALDPVGPASEFASTSEPIYAFFNFADMTNGTEWTYVWLRGSVEMLRETATWQWGAHGRAYVFFAPLGGYEVAEYQVLLYLGDRLWLDGKFAIK